MSLSHITRYGLLATWIVCGILTWPIIQNEKHRFLTPMLFESIKYGNEFKTQRLLASGANANAKLYNMSMLQWAIAKQKIEIVDLLINHGADVNEILSDKNNTVLHDAVMRRNTNIVIVLINNGAAINAKTKDGRTPLHYNAWKNSTEIEMVLPLIKMGAMIDSKDMEGYTPLHCAVRYRRLPLTQLLIKNGASINLGNNKNKTPLDTALMRNYPKIITLLREAGAKESKHLNE